MNTLNFIVKYSQCCEVSCKVALMASNIMNLAKNNQPAA